MYLACFNCRVSLFFIFLAFTDFVGDRCCLNPGRSEIAVNVVERDFDLLGRIFTLQN